MTAFLSNIGTAVPRMTISRAESQHVAKILCEPYLTHTDWLKGVYEKCGVDTRHQVLGRSLIEDLLAGTRLSGSPFLPGKPGGPTTSDRMAIYAREAPPLALEACQNAFECTSFRPSDITHLVTVSCTGFCAPGIDVLFVKSLKLNANVERIHVGFMGCHGAINGLRVASAITTANPRAKVLLVAVELCSIHCYYGAELDKLLANALFADGAAAVIVSAQHAALCVLATGSHLIDNSEREMAWHIGDHGFIMTLTKQIPKLIAIHLRSWLEPWLASHGYTVPSIRHWAVHPGGPKILDAVQESLSLSHLTVSREILSQYGNMSSPTVLFILQKMLQEQEPGPTILLSFGPGLIAEVALLDSVVASPLRSSQL